MSSSSESWEPLTAPTSVALTCRWRSRPQHHNRTHAPQQTEQLFDHLIGPGEQRERKGETKRLCGLEIYDQFNFHQLMDGKVGWLVAFDDTSGVDADLAVRI